MAAVVAGSTHAPLTAILILFELTRDVYVLLPIMLAATVATVVARVIERDSIYTFKLRRAGVLSARRAT
jgi:CIC family chloride channel protein